MRRKPSQRGSLRPYVLFTITGAFAVSAAIFLAGAGGAGGNPSSSDGVSAQPLTTQAFGPSVVNVASLPKATAGPHVAQSLRARIPRSPLGKAGLANAKKNGPTNAPSVDGPINAAPVPKTPGGSLNGFDGMVNLSALRLPALRPRYRLERRPSRPDGQHVDQYLRPFGHAPDGLPEESAGLLRRPGRDL